MKISKNGLKRNHFESFFRVIFLNKNQNQNQVFFIIQIFVIYFNFFLKFIFVDIKTSQYF